MNHELTTKRLQLRTLRAGDEEFLAGLDADPKVMQHINEGPISVAEAFAIARQEIELAAYRLYPGKWIIEHRDIGVRIGWVDLSKYRGPRIDDSLSDDLQIGYELSPEYWGQGYATEAVSMALSYAFDIGLSRVVAYARPENSRSIRVLEKLGFEQVGVCQDGGDVDCTLYLLSADKWHKTAGY